MVYIIVNILAILGVLYFEFKRLKIIKDIQNIEPKKTFRYYSGIWHNKSRFGDYEWKVFLILKEELKSKNNKMIKFSIEQVISENKSDIESDFENYKRIFYTSTGGGWVEANSKNLLEYEPISIYEKRNKKLEQLGIK